MSYDRGKEYFANAPTDEIGDILTELATEYYRYIDTNGYYGLWQSVYRMYYYGFFSKGEILPYGRQGELSKVNVNHFRNILEHIKVLTTDQRPVFEPKAINTDFKSAAQVRLAKSLLDYYMTQENLDDVLDSALDFALQSGEGWVLLEWDRDLGKVVGQIDPENPDEDTEEEPEEETEDDEDIEQPDIKREGNVKASSHHPIDVIRDWYKDTTENNDWYIVRRRVNKFNLAAKYPRFREEIIGTELESSDITLRAIDDYDFKRFGESDQAYSFLFRHSKTAAVPEGREVEFLSDGTVLFDSDLPYTDISVYRLMPTTRKNTNFGYSVSFDMLSPQKVLDMLDSTIVTNQSTFGVQNIITQKGSGLTTTELAGGLNKIEFSGDFEPKSLSLVNTQPEIFNYKNDTIQQMETISGVNSVSRGNPEASLRSGSSLALVQSMTIQFNSGLQRSYTRTLEKVGGSIISMLQDYAHAPRVALIAGISNKQYIKEFKGSDLDNIDRVVVAAGNPLGKTPQGRAQIADNLVQRGLIDSPEMYLQVIETGMVEPMIEGKQDEIMQIKSENEALSEGGQAQAVLTDNHHLHIKEHKTVISGGGRTQPEVVESTLGHIQEHINLLRTSDPGLLMVLGQQPIPSPMNSPQMGMQAPAVPPQPEENTPQQGQMGTPPPGGEEAMSSGAASAGVKMPSMPNNPMTGQEFNPQTGGL